MGNGVISSRGQDKGEDTVLEQCKRALVSASPLDMQIPLFASLFGGNAINNISDDLAEERQMVCIDNWSDISNTIHKYSDGQSLRGIELFCKMFLANLNANDSTPDKFLFRTFTPRHGSHNYSSAAILRRIIRYLLSIRHENRNVKQNLRALGRTHARIKIERAEFDLFSISFLETLMLFPGVTMSSTVIEAWSSLLKFAVDQMCFDKIVFKDHCTLPDDHKKQFHKGYEFSTTVGVSSKAVTTVAPSAATYSVVADEVAPSYAVDRNTGSFSDGKVTLFHKHKFALPRGLEPVPSSNSMAASNKDNMEDLIPLE